MAMADGGSRGGYFTLAGIAICALVADLALLKHHYEHETYFPYTAAPNLLFLIRGVRVEPSPPPNKTLYLTDKLIIAALGYIFAVIPYLGVSKALEKKDHALSDWETVLLVVLLVQLVMTLIPMILFQLFYLWFLIEALTRFFCFCFCIFRPRTNTAPVEADEHILATHESDPLYYKPYELIYVNL
jgi:hypothetical protein